MSKVGILSMQRIKNYGSFLQAYALKKTIESLGHEVEFVDYHIEDPIIMSNSKNKGIIKKGFDALHGKAKLIHKIQYIKHKKNFNKYFDILGLTNEPNFNPKLDTLVIGSDEVFNVIQANKNVGYSLELFGKDNNASKVITYAASFGNTTIEKINKYGKSEEISELLNNIDSISIRDQNSFNIVKSLTGKDTIINLDPVLTYDYINKCQEIPNIVVNEKFIIVYAYSNRITSDESSYIKEYAKRNNLKVYAIGGAQRCADRFIDCSPFEVLAYFKNAKYIITDTFHGSIFSIINHKSFVTLVRKSIGNKYGNEEKLTDLLNRLSLSDRIIYDIKDMDNILQKNIDYKDIEDIIAKYRENAIEYLKKEIK